MKQVDRPSGKTRLRADLLARDRKRRERRRAAVGAAGVQPAARNDLLPNLQLVRFDVAALRAPARNVRKIDPAHVQEVAGSIATLGFSTPVIIDEDGVVIDGVVKAEAAKLLGLATLPCIVVGHLTAQEKRLLRLATNRLAENGTWSLPDLKLELEELILEDAPVEITGFALEEVDQILLDDETAIEQGELEPTSDAAAVARLGDVLELGPHRVICGNATDPATIDRVMDGHDAARLVLTDQPYNVKS